MIEKIEEMKEMLNDVRTYINNLGDNDYFLEGFKLCLIKELIHIGLTYNPEIKEVVNDNKKFFAFKSINNNEKEILEQSEHLAKSLIDYFQEKDLNFNNYEFSIIKIEILRDKDCFSNLVRGLLTYKRKND